MFERVLVAYDGSEAADAGLGFAVELARRFDGELTLAYVIAPEDGGSRRGLESREAAETWLAKAARRLPTTGARDLKRMVVEAPKADRALLDLAEESGYGLIVCGRGARGTLRRFVLGGVAERVIEFAPCSVAVFPEHPDPHSLSTVIAGYDASEVAREALAAAAAIAARFSAPLHIVHAASFAVPFAGQPYSGVEELIRTEGEELLAEAKARITAPLEAVTVELREGDPRLELVRAAEEHGHPMIVVGHRGAGGFAGLRLGGTARQVVRGARCPVLVAK